MTILINSWWIFHSFGFSYALYSLLWTQPLHQLLDRTLYRCPSGQDALDILCTGRLASQGLGSSCFQLLLKHDFSSEIEPRFFGIESLSPWMPPPWPFSETPTGTPELLGTSCKSLPPLPCLVPANSSRVSRVISLRCKLNLKFPSELLKWQDPAESKTSTWQSRS